MGRDVRMAVARYGLSENDVQIKSIGARAA
jgi:hypothetical protein